MQLLRKQWKEFFWELKIVGKEVSFELDLNSASALLNKAFKSVTPLLDIHIFKEKLGGVTILKVYFKSNKKLNSQTDRKFYSFLNSIKGILTVELTAGPVKITPGSLNEYFVSCSNNLKGFSLCTKHVFDKTLLLCDLNLGNVGLLQEETSPLFSSAERADSFQSYIDGLVTEAILDTPDNTVDFADSSLKTVSMVVNSGLEHCLQHLVISPECVPFKGYLERFQNHAATIEKIFSLENNIIEKQVLLETMGTSLNRDILELKYILPSSTKNLLYILDLVFKNKSPSSFSHASLYLELKGLFTSKKSLFEGLNTEHFLEAYVESESSKPRKVTQVANQKFVLLFSLLDTYGESLGLLCIHIISNAFRSQLDPLELAQNIFKEGKKKESWQTPNFSILSKICVQREVDKKFVFLKKRTGLQAELSFGVLKNLGFCSNLFKKNEKLNKTVKNAFDALIHSFGIEDTKAGVETHLMLKDIVSFNEKNVFSIDFNFSLEEKRMLGELLLTVFEIIGLLGFENHAAGNKKTVGMSTISDDFVRSLFTLGVVGSNLPLIIPGRKWQAVNNTPELKEGSVLQNKSKLQTNFGGFISIRNQYFPAIKTRGMDSYEVLNSDHLVQLNFLQGVPFKINIGFLNHCKKNWVRMLLLFSNSPLINGVNNEISSSHTNSIFTFNPRTEKLSLMSEKEFIQQFVNLDPTFAENNSDNPCEDTEMLRKYKLSLKFKRMQMGEKLYVQQVADAAGFIEILHTASLFSECTLYFTWAYDHRFRVYANAGLLSPQGCDLSKALLELGVE